MCKMEVGECVGGTKTECHVPHIGWVEVPKFPSRKHVLHALLKGEEDMVVYRTTHTLLVSRASCVHSKNTTE